MLVKAGASSEKLNKPGNIMYIRIDQVGQLLRKLSMFMHSALRCLPAMREQVRLLACKAMKVRFIARRVKANYWLGFGKLLCCGRENESRTNILERRCLLFGPYHLAAN